MPSTLTFSASARLSILRLALLKAEEDSIESSRLAYLDAVRVESLGAEIAKLEALVAADQVE